MIEKLYSLAAAAAADEVSKKTFIPNTILPHGVLKYLAKTIERFHGFRNVETLLNLNGLGMGTINCNGTILKRNDLTTLNKLRNLRKFVLSTKEYIILKSSDWPDFNWCLMELLENHKLELVKLDLSYLGDMNSSGYIYGLINKLEKLRKLILNGVELSSISIFQSNFLEKNLKHLDISNSGLENLDGISRFVNLEVLILHNVEIGLSCMQELYRLEKLVYLDLSHDKSDFGYKGPFETICQDFEVANRSQCDPYWKNLKELDLSGLRIGAHEECAGNGCEKANCDFLKVRHIIRAHKKLEFIGLMFTGLERNLIGNECKFWNMANLESCVDAFWHYAHTSRHQLLETLSAEIQRLWRHTGLTEEQFKKLLQAIALIIKNNATLEFWMLAVELANALCTGRIEAGAISDDFVTSSDDYDKEMIMLSSALINSFKLFCETSGPAILPLNMNLANILRNLVYDFRKVARSSQFFFILERILFSATCSTERSRILYYNRVTFVVKTFYSYLRYSIFHENGNPTESMVSVGMLLLQSMNRIVNEDNHDGDIWRVLLIHMIMWNETNTILMRQRGALLLMTNIYKDGRQELAISLFRIFWAHPTQFPIREFLDTGVLTTMMINDSEARIMGEAPRWRPELMNETTEFITSVTQSLTWRTTMMATISVDAANIMTDDDNITAEGFIQILMGARDVGTLVGALWVLASLPGYGERELCAKLRAHRGAFELIQNIFKNEHHSTIPDLPFDVHWVAYDFYEATGMMQTSNQTEEWFA